MFSAYVIYTCLACGIHNDNQHLIGRLLVGLDDHRSFRIFGMQTFDIRPYRARVNQPPIDPDLVIRADSDQNIGIGDALSSRRIRPPASLMNEAVTMKKMSIMKTTSSIGVRLISFSSSSPPSPAFDLRIFHTF
jgi:hypothetical protein